MVLDGEDIMPINLKSVVPWGRSFSEYCAMFNLAASDLKLNILGCADGPASFNSILTKQNGKIISVDPIYQFTADEIEKRIEETKRDIIGQMDKNKDEYIWDEIKSIPQLAEIRMNAMRDFLADFEIGKQQKRYVTGELPQLPFENHSFDCNDPLCMPFFMTSEVRSLTCFI